MALHRVVQVDIHNFPNDCSRIVVVHNKHLQLVVGVAGCNRDKNRTHSEGGLLAKKQGSLRKSELIYLDQD